MEMTLSSETSDNFRTTRRHIPEYRSPQTQGCDNMVSKLSLVCSVPVSGVYRTASIYDALRVKFPPICIEEEMYIKIKRQVAVPGRRL
jgi:hypothetical protein